MWSVTSTAYARHFENDEAPVFVFLCDGYQTASLKWLVENWLAIHRNAAHRWHMVVPTVEAINDHAELATPANYDVTLAREMIQIYGIRTLGDPILVLDNFDDSRKQLVLRLPKNPNDIRGLIQDITNLTERLGHEQSRSQLTDRLYDELRRNMTLRRLVNLAPRAASALLRIPIKSD